MADEPQTVGDVLDMSDGVTELDAVLDVNVDITAVLGTAMMPISQILKLGRGAVVELNRGVGEDIEIHANSRLVATGEVIVIEDRLGININNIIRLTETVSR
ncbi:MAG: flagellar motor switch protein FliN [Magnetovibrio sp.]|nr:flagellar motor switch protein FliN [Magnetovibrio sp.]|tara:strand:- start:332 stop:637 length:306 start_codon:yes stop_codon:yes gene_type:complete